jgi:outer membrane immunogenic protein
MKLALILLLFYSCNAFSQAEDAPVNDQANQSEVLNISPWAGQYVGGVLGYQFGKSGTTSGSFGYNADGETWSFDESGFNIGGQVGFNNSWHGLLIGPEFEVGYLSLRGDGAQPASPGGDTVAKISSDLYTALRLRVGAEAGDHLVFGSVGLIGVNTETKIDDGCGIAPCGGTTMAGSKKTYDWGYSLGAGVEHRLKSGWSLKLEYLYFDLGKRKFNGVTNLGDSYEWTSETKGSILRAGLSSYF